MYSGNKLEKYMSLEILRYDPVLEDAVPIFCGVAHVDIIILEYYTATIMMHVTVHR